MSHELMQNDNMFSVRETPWHGLGVILPEAPSIDEALKISNLDWQVRGLPLYAQQPGKKGAVVRSKIAIPTHQAIQREDTEEIFTVVSSRYEILQNTEAFEVFRPLVEDGQIELETAGSLQNGRKVWILAKVSGVRDAEVMEGDVIKPYVLLSNSHDASQAVRFGFTPIRVVCWNTLTFATESEESKLVRVYHRGNLKDNLDALRESLDLASGRFVARIDKYQKMAKMPINKKDFQKYVRQVLSTDIEESAREKQIFDMLLNGKGGLGTDDFSKASWWHAYNAINEWALYQRGRSAENRLASAWFGDGYTLDVKAFQIADDFVSKAA